MIAGTKREKAIVLAAVLVGAAAVGGAVHLIASQLDDPVLACLDSGGCWDHQRNTCEFEDQWRCTPERCVQGPDGRLRLPDERPQP